MSKSSKESLANSEMAKKIEQLNLGTPEEIVAEADRCAMLVHKFLNDLMPVDIDKLRDHAERDNPLTTEQSHLCLLLTFETIMELDKAKNAVIEAAAICSLMNVVINQVCEISDTMEQVKQ